MDTIQLLAGLLAYIVAGRMVLRHLTGGWRELIFAGLNLAGVFFFYSMAAMSILPCALAFMWPWSLACM